jgi:hypothetical protein
MKQTAVEWLRDLYENQPAYDESILDEQWQKAIEMEKEQACDFADYVINRAKEFEDGLIDHREYEGSIDEMFERRYRDGGAELSTEEKQYWEDVDKLRKEREEKYK